MIFFVEKLFFSVIPNTFFAEVKRFGDASVVLRKEFWVQYDLRKEKGFMLVFIMIIIPPEIKGTEKGYVSGQIEKDVLGTGGFLHDRQNFIA